MIPRMRVRAFSLIEILLVVVILGILAAIALPLYSHGTKDAQAVALAQDLRLLQRFLLIYKGQHNEVMPGYPGGDTSQAPTEAAFFDQALKASNESGQTADPGTAGFRRGPYLQKIPANPVNGKTSILMLGNADNFPVAADDNHGWVYKASTGELHADCRGEDAQGVSFYSY